MNAGASIRPATLDDAAAVWPLAHGLATSFVPELAAFTRTFSALIPDVRALVLVAEREPGDLVGYLLAHRLATFFANAPVVWIEELFVDERARGHGAGRALVSGAEQWAQSIGAAYVSLATRRATSFYATIGYVESAAFLKKQLR